MRAVKAGYNFNLFPEETLSGIGLEPTGGKVCVEGVMILSRETMKKSL